MPVGSVGVVEPSPLARGSAVVVLAPPFLRDVPGLPRQSNFSGVSFSVAYLLACLSWKGIRTRVRRPS